MSDIKLKDLSILELEDLQNLISIEIEKRNKPTPAEKKKSKALKAEVAKVMADYKSLKGIYKTVISIPDVEITMKVKPHNASIEYLKDTIDCTSNFLSVQVDAKFVETPAGMVSDFIYGIEEVICDELYESDIGARKVSGNLIPEDLGKRIAEVAKAIDKCHDHMLDES